MTDAVNNYGQGLAGNQTSFQKAANIVPDAIGTKLAAPKFIRPLCTSGKTVVADVNGDLWHVDADAGHIRRVVVL